MYEKYYWGLLNYFLIKGGLFWFYFDKFGIYY